MIHSLPLLLPELLPVHASLLRLLDFCLSFYVILLLLFLLPWFQFRLFKLLLLFCCDVERAGGMKGGLFPSGLTAIGEGQVCSREF